MSTCHFVQISCFVYTFSLMHTHCPTSAHLLIHAHYFFILIDTFVQFHLCLFLFHPHASLYLQLLLMYTFGLMLTQCSLRTCLPLVVVICFPHTLFASCTVIIICTLFAFIYIFSSFMHLLYSYLALASVFLFCPYSAHCSFSFVSLFTFISPYLSHLISCASWSTYYSFSHLPTCHFLLPFLPCYFPGFSFHQIPILFTISMFNFATLLPCTSPPPSFNSFIVTISSFFYSSFNFISDFFPLLFSTLISFLLPFTHLAPHTFGPFP